MNGFGCLKETSSIRTYTYDAVCGASNIEVPQTYLLPAPNLPRVTNQKTTSACVAFALAEILSIFNRKEFGDKEEVSEGFIYAYHRNAPYCGMYPQKAIDSMTKVGSPLKKHYDKLYEMPELYDDLFADKNLDTLVELAEKYKIKGYVGFLRGEVEEVKRALYEHQIPIFAVADSYFGQSHAIIIVGWKKDGWIIQNSWGETYGDKGRTVVPYEALQQKYLLIDEVFELKFNDVDKDKWYYDAIKETVFNGLMKGTSDETFEPDRPITRGEMAQLCVNLCKKIDDVIALSNKEN